MNVYKILAVLILFSLITVFLRNYKSEYALLVQLASIVVIGFIIISYADVFLETIEEISSFSNESILYLKVLLKALSISILTEIASSFCVDSSSQTLAKGVELIGKTAIFSLIFPILKSFIESVIGFLE